MTTTNFFPFLPKLADLGLARPRYDESDLTASNVAVGTPVTMAPEQVLWPDQVDFRADIYGLGCVLYHMLTGRPAFVDGSPSQILVRKATGETPDLGALPAGAPEPLRELLKRMLAPLPADRYSSYHDLIDAMDSLLAQSSADSLAIPPAKMREVLAAVSAAHSNVEEPSKLELPLAQSSALLPRPTPIAPPDVLEDAGAQSSDPAPSTSEARPDTTPGSPPPSTSPRRAHGPGTLAGVAALCLAIGLAVGWLARTETGSPPPTPPPDAAQPERPIDRAAERQAMLDLGQLLRSKSTPDGGFDNELSPSASAWGCGQGIRALALVADASHQRLLEVLPDLGLRGPSGEFAGYPFVGSIDTIACLEPTAEVGMALGLAHGRLEGDPAPLGHTVFDFLLRTQNDDGSFPTLPVLGAKAARPSATVMALHALVPLGHALGRDAEAVEAGSRAALIPELPGRFRDADTWQVADLLYGVAVIAHTDPGSAAPLAFDLVKNE